MERHRLGGTDLEVTPIGFGGMELRGPRVWNGREVDDAEAGALLEAVLDAGINLIDTAPAYGPCEEWIGRFIGPRRDQFVIATKCGSSLVNRGEYDETPHIWTAEHIEHNLEHSLRRLRTDHVDLWQLHNPSVRQVKESGLVDAMYRAKHAGKVRYVGVSTTVPHAATFLEWGVFDQIQLPYSALEREHEEVLEQAAAAGIGVIARGGMARGAPGVGQGSQGRWRAWEHGNLDELLEQGDTPTTFLLRFMLGDARVHSTLVGTLSRAHLADDIAAAERGPLSADLREEVLKRLDQRGPSEADQRALTRH